jgi:hypothetical protein
MRLFLLTTLLTAGIVCSPAPLGNFSYKDCLQQKTIPSDCLIDTLGILGVIATSDSSLKSTLMPGNSPASSWTPNKADVLRAEEIFRYHAAREYRCIDSNYTSFFRQYTGRGLRHDIVLIQGTKKSHDATFSGYHSVWVNIYEGECSLFEAVVNIRNGDCVISVKKEND